MSLEEELKVLIRPIARWRDPDFDRTQYVVDIDKWEYNVLKTCAESLSNIERADKEERAIPRSEILRLAVATNQLRRQYLFKKRFDNPANYQATLKKCQEVCTRFKVKGLTQVSDASWTGKTPLERAIHQAVMKKGTHCRRCGRLLTNPDSVRRGIGPVCWGKTQRGEK